MEKRLLLVEDDAQLARSMARYLEAYGWRVDSSNDGASGVQQLASSDYSLVIVDLQLPYVSGLDLLRTAMQRANPPDVIVLSGYLDVSSTLQALELGAIEVLEKPFPPEVLVNLLEQTVMRRAIRAGSSEPPPGRAPLAHEILGVADRTRALRATLESIARFHTVSVLIVGETGTGKELVARALHRLSGLPGPMLALNCASVPEELFESELFGHEAGAFTGARGARRGLFEAAAGGSIFLDEVGELPPSQQAKLLRVLETRTFRRVGASAELPMEARVISATNRPLASRNASECMRADLFYRLAGFTIRTPPLRDRKEDLEPLALHFLRDFAKNNEDLPTQLSEPVLRALRAYDWPGNVRELKAVIQNAAIRTQHCCLGIRELAESMAEQGCVPRRVEDSAHPDADMRAASPRRSTDGAVLALGSQRIAALERPAIGPRDGDLAAAESGSLASPISMESLSGGGLPDVEYRLISQAYRAAGGNISLAARQLGIPRTTLRDRLRRFGLA